MFFDLIQEGCKLQVLCSSERLASGSTVTGEESLDFKRLLRRGDILCRYFSTLLPELRC